jgi:uncharacterized membrane protein YqgA involved in biofilm formation
MPFKGTLVNVLTVVIGSLVGMAIGDRLSERVKTTVLSCLGLGTILIGVKLAILTQHLTLVIAALLLGGVTGTLLDLERKLEAVAVRLKAGVRSDSATFVTGFVTASLLFCVGPMTVIGSIQDGTMGDASLLYTKSVLDGFASVALASGLGVGVLFAALTVLIFQGGLTLAGAALADLAGSQVIVEMSATGGLLILAIGLYLLDIRKLPLANLLPALLYIIPLTLAFG